LVAVIPGQKAPRTFPGQKAPRTLLGQNGFWIIAKNHFEMSIKLFGRFVFSTYTGGKTMKIYKLTPRDQGSEVWSGSDFKGSLIVRAKESDNALRMARLKYKVTQTHQIESQVTAYGPWTGANTDFDYVTDSKYSIEGDEEILEEIPQKEV
jgi:hypothetical protein